MTPEHLSREERIELESAQRLLDFAAQRAAYHCGADDREATAAAILCKALELATPDLSPRARAALFLDDGDAA